MADAARRVIASMSGLRMAWVWGPCLGYMAMIFALSSRSQVPDLAPDTHAHLVEYTGLGLVWARAVAGGAALVTPRLAGIAWGAASVYGASDEMHQAFVPAREASFKDLAMDVVGSAVGAGAALGYARARARSRARGGRDGACGTGGGER